MTNLNGTAMNNIFHEVEKTAKFVGQLWESFRDEISQNLPESYQDGIDTLSNRVNQALSELINDIRNPTLILATTGTTSSGKSTLVNLLCGAEIVPVAVSEMSAGTVTIEYSETKKLVINHTPGAMWDCGIWEDITDDEIYHRLYDVMIAYLDARSTRPDLLCPQSTIYYPFSLIKDQRLVLPEGTRVKILDLPGLSHVGDEGNASVIRQCRDALCLVTYNSAETDQKRIQNLLREVVEQVKDLGGSPARMLFILNRIDVFRSDRSWPESERRFIENTVESIKGELLEHLREYEEDITDLEIVKLSSWPALLGLQIQQSSSELRAEACKKADNNFNGLIEDVLEDLPRNVQKWNDFECQRVTEELLKNSYADLFFQKLQQHVSKNFPILIIPQLISKFNISAGHEMTEWSRQTTSAILKSSEEEFRKECENIELIRKSIRNFLEVSTSALQKPFEEADREIKRSLEGESSKDLILPLEDAIVKITELEAYRGLENKILPLLEWRRVIGQAINTILESVAESLESGSLDLSNPYLLKVNHLQVNLLGKTLTKLIHLGYTKEQAKNGWRFIAKTEEEKRKLQEINDNLNELAIHLSIVMKESLQKIIAQEEQRISESLEILSLRYLESIQEQASSIAPNLSIKFPTSNIIDFSSKNINFLDIDINFKASFVVKKGSWTERVDNYVEKRVWYFLWLAKDIVKEESYETRESNDAEIPSIEDLLISWVNQGQQLQGQIVRKVCPWILNKIGKLKQKIELIQKDVIDRYQTRLEKAREEITLDYEKEHNFWQPLHIKSIELSEELDKLTELIKSSNDR
ncbi:dynamin family protein [Synechococcus elongatus IITB4]|uniref:dynamin family protein n=1 Tax=Synechococcus elongatus TaxID=32046 RepID=UPI0030CB084E